VPLLPTVPFILLAAFCFARSSGRLHAWLMSRPGFAYIVTNWQQKRAIGTRLKRRALLACALSFAISIYLVPVLTLKLILLGMGLLLLFFLWRIPELEQE
jgi:uncharacterized protein